MDESDPRREIRFDHRQLFPLAALLEQKLLDSRLPDAEAAAAQNRH
ncbi:MAG: hypothetical protein PHI39_10405 [Kiritimatiellae bacterium]|nr:hypothetical protein [Kiritimatiellia bacterium]